MSVVSAEFKAKTDLYFDPIEGLNQTDIESILISHINDAMEGFSGFHLVDVVVCGSRCRGLETEDSDLDAIVIYDCTPPEKAIKEDVVFNILNDQEDELCIGDVKVDFNPKYQYDEPYIDGYLKQCEDYLAEKASERKEREV